MPESTADRGHFPPRSAVLLPLALLVHQAEEWFGGFPEWTRFALGSGIGPERFLFLNAAGLLLFTVWTWAAFRERRMAWIVVSLATLLGLNAIVHAIASLVSGLYSPGTASGLVVSLPVSAVILRASQAALPGVQVLGAMAAGVLLHGVVTLLALA